MEDNRGSISKHKRINNMKRTLLVAIIAIFSTVTAFGQSPQRITLQEAVNIALENNYALKQAENNLDLADGRITSEYADFLPSLSASTGYSKTTGQQFIADILAFDDRTSAGASGRIGANIEIFNGFENILSLRQSEHNKVSMKERVKRAKETVIFNTARAYLTVLVNIELVDIARDNLETSQKVLNQTKAQVEVGSRPVVDQYNQESIVASNELSVIQQENALRLSRVQLIRQLQVDPLTEYELVTPDIDLENISATPEGLQLGMLIDEALTNRSDIKSEEASIASQKLQLQMTKFNLLPTISASGSISTRWTDQYFLPDATFSDQFFDQQVNKGFSVSLNFPLFQNWNRMYNIQSSKVQLKNAQLSLENSKLGVVQEVTQAFNDFTNYRKELESAGKSQLASGKAFETAQERYNVGASTLIELSEAQSTYVSAQSQYLRAQYNLVFQEKLLDYYLGKLNGEDIKF